MPTSLTLEINFKGKLHKRILDAVRERVKASKAAYETRHKQWIAAEEKVLAYLPERAPDAERRLQREGGMPTYTTIQVPYSYGVLMASHTYWTTVFMSRTPVLQYTGRHGESQQKVQALEALVDYQMLVGEMLVPLYIWLYDTGKYGVGIIGMHWEEEVAHISSIEEVDESFLGFIPTGKTKKIKTTRKVKGYTGNKLTNIRPFDFFPDPRVPMKDFQRGEFVAVYKEIGWNTVLRRNAGGYYTNIDRIKPGASTGSYQRTEGSSQLELPKSDTFYFDKDNKKSSVIQIYECHIELVPNDWGLGSSKMPEKWVFTTDATFTTVIGAQPLGANHNKFPMSLTIMEPEGYALMGRGIPEILNPVQNTLDWLLNAHFYNVRKAINDQFVVDPSRVVMADVLDPLPGGIWRLKPAAYGTDTRTVASQLPVVDVTQAHMSDMRVMNEIGQRATGVSDQLLGVLQAAGGRKTATEVRTASSFGVNRLKTSSEFFSAMGWSPMSQMLVQNSQQYYDGEQQFKIVGDLMQEAGENFVNVSPDDISGFYNFVPVDGTLPVDRFAQANLWKELFGQMRAMPEIAQQYDTGRIFAWVAQLAGLKNINQFKIQVGQDENLAREAEKGNLIPLTGKDVPGQLPNIGATG